MPPPRGYVMVVRTVLDVKNVTSKGEMSRTEKFCERKKGKKATLATAPAIFSSLVILSSLSAFLVQTIVDGDQ